MPSLLKQVPPGIQALVYMDKLIDWTAYNHLIKRIEVLKTVSPLAFLKLCFLKYAFGLTTYAVIENVKDRRSFQNYIGSNLSEGLNPEETSEFEHFTSAFGNLGELIAGVDEALLVHRASLERKGGEDFRLIPYLMHKPYSESDDFALQHTAVWF